LLKIKFEKKQKTRKTTYMREKKTT